MSKDEEYKIVESLKGDIGPVRKLIKLLELRRERHRGSIESADNEQTRGRAHECRDLLKLLLNE